MRVAFYIVIFLIAYGSLYPFNFHFDQPTHDKIQALFNFDLRHTRISDLISNVILFIPFGILAQAIYPFKKSTKSTLIILSFGFAFAFVVQGLQLWAHGRLPWGGDALWNLLGCAIGIVCYEFLRIDRYKALSALNNRQQISTVLVIALLAMELAPFAPTLDFDVFKNNLKAVLSDPKVNAFWLFENTVFWLCSFFLIRYINPVWNRCSVYIPLVCSLLLIKFIVISSGVSLSQLFAGILAIMLWYFFQKFTTAKGLALLATLAIVGNGLYPFTLKPEPTSFHWIPFTGSLNGNILLNIIAVSKKMVFYAVMLWLIFLSGKPLKFSIFATSLIIFLSEYTQSFFTNSVSESTDAVLVLILGFIIHQQLQKTNTLQASSEPVPHHQNSTPAAIPPSPSSSAHTSYIPTLDGLRGIAALSVFIVHFQQFTDYKSTVAFIDIERWMINGNTGVALFFVLSGFLLSIPFWQASKEKQLPSIKNYMTNRAIRVIPIYYLCLFGILALKGFQGSEANLNNIITHVLFLHNLKDYQVMSLNPPFWTLAVEFQFYLLLPLLFLGLSRLNYRNGQVLCFLLIFTVYFAYRSSMFALESWEAWPIKIPLVWPFQIEVFNSNGASLTYSLFAHLPHFLIGVFAASLYRLKTKPSAATEALFWLSAVLIFIILATPLDDVFQMDFGRYNFPVIPLLLGIIVFTAPSTSLARRLLELSAVKWVGLISYGIYLYHYPIQKAGKMLFNKAQVDISQHPFLYLAFTLTVTLITAFISYKLIEKPLMSRFKRHSASTNTAPKHNDARPAQESLTAIDVVRPRTTETASLSGSSETQEPSAKKKTYHRASANKRNRAPKNKRLILLATASVLIIAAILFATPNTPKVNVFQPEWSSSKTPEMIFDHHTHTTYSDGSLSINQLVENAFIGGCDALAITDHSLNGSISTQKFAEISKVRKAYPGLLILSGIELGMPSYQGREHVNIITTPNLERSLLPKVMDSLQQSSSLKPQQKDEFVLNTINSVTDAKNNTIAIYNHPSRKDKTASENINDINQWNQEQAYITGIAGAPGHQNRSTIGSYFSRFSTQDRWDPAVATVGGTWDQLLQQEQRIWGAIASSDYHSKSMDYDPCAFSRIHVNTPSRDYAGLMQGIKAGTFWADHGQLLSRYDFSVSVEGAVEPAYPGAELALTEAESLLVVDISFDKTSRYADDFMRVDIISNCSTGEVTATSKYLQPSEAATNVYLILPEKKNNCYVRSRVVRETPEDNDLSAYSNPVFITF